MRRGLEYLFLGLGLGTISTSCLSIYPSSRATGGYSEAPREYTFLSEREQFCSIQPENMIPVEVSVYDSEGPEQWTNDEITSMSDRAQWSFKDIQKAIATPRQAGIYCTSCLTHGDKGKDPGAPSIDKARFGVEDWWMSGEQTHAMKAVDCDDGAIAAGSLLKDDGYVLYVLVVEGISDKGKDFGHAVELYKTSTGMLGSIGINKSDNRAPRACSIDEFLKEWSVETGDSYKNWVIYDLGRAFPDYDTNLVNNRP